MPDTFAALSTCIATLEPLDHGERARVLHALTAALDLTVPVVVRNVVVGQTTSGVAVVGLATTPKKKVEPKPTPKARKWENAGTRISDEAILDAIRHGCQRPHEIGAHLGRTPGGVHNRLQTMLAVGLIRKTGKGPAVRYSIPTSSGG